MPDIENKVMIHCVRREVAQDWANNPEHTLFEEANAGMTQLYERLSSISTTDRRTDQPSFRTVGSLDGPTIFSPRIRLYPDDMRTAFLNCAK